MINLGGSKVPIREQMNTSVIVSRGRKQEPNIGTFLQLKTGNNFSSLFHSIRSPVSSSTIKNQDIEIVN